MQTLLYVVARVRLFAQRAKQNLTTSIGEDEPLTIPGSNHQRDKPNYLASWFCLGQPQRTLQTCLVGFLLASQVCRVWLRFLPSQAKKNSDILEQQMRISNFTLTTHNLPPKPTIIAPQQSTQHSFNQRYDNLLQHAQRVAFCISRAMRPYTTLIKQISI